MLEIRVLREIFRSMRDEIKEQWRRQYTAEFCDLYCSRNITRVVKLKRMRTGHVTGMAEKRDAYTFVVGKLEVKRKLRRPRHRGKDNIKVNFQVVERRHELN